MYELRWDGDTLRIWDSEGHVPVCAVYLAKKPKQRAEMAQVITRALNEYYVEHASPKIRRVAF